MRNPSPVTPGQLTFVDLIRPRLDEIVWPPQTLESLGLRVELEQLVEAIKPGKN